MDRNLTWYNLLSLTLVLYSCMLIITGRTREAHCIVITIHHKEESKEWQEIILITKKELVIHAV